MSTARILVPREKALLKQVHDFHLKHAGEFLLPRLLSELDKFAVDGELWVALVDADVVATCYVSRPDDDAKEAEFGGIIVRPDHVGVSGIGTAIGTVALSSHFLHDVAPAISHVHLENKEPLELLTKRLGFTMRNEKPIEIRKADLEKRLGRKIDMKADADGFIRGNTFDFGPPKLKEFADRLESGKLGRIATQVESPYFTGDALKESVGILRQLAGHG